MFDVDKAAIRELESISYDLFDKVSARMWGNNRIKGEIREIQARLDKMKWTLIDAAVQRRTKYGSE